MWTAVSLPTSANNLKLGDEIMSYEKILEQNKDWIDSTWQKLDEKLSRLAVKSRDKIPYTTKNGTHDSRTEGKEIRWWTNGFWGGLMWLMYAGTEKECYKLTAQNAEKIMDGAWNYFETLHHDVGFMWHIMSGASYRLTGDEKSKNRNLLGAATLASRYNIDGEFIVAWNGEKKKGWSIIDTMMNIPQLYWAAKETGDDRFVKIAQKHADMAMRDHVRPDGSVAHIVSHNTDRPEVIETFGGQGYGVGSSWSRGATWALYGFVLSYIHSGKTEYLDTAKKVAHYFIANVASTNWLPLLDFRAPDEPVKYDSTAGAIAACGLIEIAKIVPEHEKSLYLTAAMNLLRAMEQAWCNWTEEEDGILLYGSERYGKGEHMHIIYGDYFFAEALLKLKGSDFLPW